jgi:CIC family chloride channel protein
MTSPNRYFDLFFRVFKLSHPLRLAVYGAVVGVISGFGAALFFYALEWVSHMLLGVACGVPVVAPAGEQIFTAEAVGEPRRWLYFLLPTIGGLLSGILVYRFAPEAEGHGTDAMIASFHHKRAIVKPRVPLIKTLATICLLGTGGCGGREGPTAQIGSGFGSWLAQRLHLGVKRRQILLLAGVGGGLSAIFRSPLGGALTAVEVLYKEDMESEALVPTVISSVIGYTIFGAIYGYGKIFEIPAFTFHRPAELLVYLALALVCLPAGMLYVWMFRAARDRVFRPMRIPRPLKPALGGLLLGLIGLALPEVYGAGWGQVQLALLGKLSLGAMAVLALAKMAGTALSIGSGGSGGVFGPTLVIGGMLGGTVGILGNMLFPELVTQPGAYVLVGMAAFFAGVANAPIGALVMVSEMTGGYALLAPLLLVSMVALLLSRRWSIYENQLTDRFHSPAHMGDVITNVLAEIRVSDCFQPGPVPAFPSSTRVDELPDAVFELDVPLILVTGKRGELIGEVSGERLRAVPASAAMQHLLILYDVMDRHHAVEEDQDLFSVLADMRRFRMRVMPVVGVDDGIVGAIRLEDVMGAYAKEIMTRKELVAEDD